MFKCPADPHGKGHILGEMERRIVTYCENEASTAEPIELPFGMVSWVSPRNCLSDGRAFTLAPRGKYR